MSSDSGQVADVMWEQFEYLMDHKRYGPCLEGCTECWRLERIKELLMLPFEWKKYPMELKKETI
jgi:hypothetical protein